MLEQLDLFSSVVSEEKTKPTDYNKLLKERKLVPPSIIEIEVSEPTPEAILPKENITAAIVETIVEIEPAVVENNEVVESVADSSEEIKDEIPVAENLQAIDPVSDSTDEIAGESSESKNVAIKKAQRGRKSQREMSLEAGRIDVPEDSVLYSKQYYSIGEVAIMFSVNASLLRYWESEFDILKPRKNKKGDRFFRPDDIKNLQLIHHLLRERKYTIDGARDFLKKGKKANEYFEAITKLKAIKAFLMEMKAAL
ncbi:MerR family transcriptional regulator [Pollutibacter soli]|uniref:MerR family transcriptional regulator n=1 Tax=Pollutibacter soli TaxID=3034157 RepID=UPI0030133EBE